MATVNEILAAGLRLVQQPQTTFQEAAASDPDPNETFTVKTIDGSALKVGEIIQLTYGKVAVMEDGSVYYKRETDSEAYKELAQGETGVDSLPYEVQDSGGLSAGIYAITFNVQGRNDKPEANDDSAVTDEDTAIDIDVLANDKDIDGDDITIAEISKQPKHGTVSINPDGTVKYTPDANFHGTDSFEYKIIESDPQANTDTATVTIEVKEKEDAPDANDDTATTKEDTSVNVNVLANDTDPDGDALTVTKIVTGPSHGTATINNDGTITYKPNDNFNGKDTLQYEISDGNGGTDTATLEITVTPENDAPVANDDTQELPEDSTVSNIPVLNNDVDPDGDTLTVTKIVTGPTHGTATLNANGTINYTPNANYNGADSLVYEITDGKLKDTATLTFNVTPRNDRPVAVDDRVTTGEDTPITHNVLANDSDIDGDAITLTRIVTAPTYGTAVINADGTITYTPGQDFVGTDSLLYEISDGELTDTGVFTIDVTQGNDAPTANDDNVTMDEDQTVTVGVLGNDTDPEGDTLTVTKIVTGPTHGEATLNADGTITYKPGANYNGSDSLVYEITDGEFTDTATVTFTVNPVNDRPVAVDDRVTTGEDTPITHNVLANDSDPEGDAITVTRIVTAPTYGTAVINADGTITYTPGQDFVGTDSLLYEISDGGLTDTGVFTIDVTEGNDAPNANDDDVTMDEDQTVTVGVIGNDTDPEGDTLTVTKIVSGPSHGEATLNPDGTITYKPGANYNGSDSLVYEITDGELTDTATVTFTVNPVNDAPNANDDSDSTDENTAVDIDVLSNDTDIDNDNLTVTKIVTGPSNGTATINPDGTIHYVPNTNYSGNDTLIYEVSDGNGGTDTATVTVNVNDVNENPDAVDDSIDTDEDTAVTINVLGNDTDPDGDTLVIDSITQQPAHGDIVVNADGTITYTPANGFVGNDSFIYRVSDGHGGFDDATVNICVNDTNAPPLAEDDYATTEAGTPVLIDVLNNDSDPDGDNITITRIVDQPKYGTAEIVDGKIKYTPNGNAPVGTEEHTIAKNGGSDLSYNISGNGNIVLNISDMISNAYYNNSLGYYFAGANGNPINGKILFDNVKQDTGGNFTIAKQDIPEGAKTLGFFIIPDGDRQNGNLGDGVDVTFKNVDGKWGAYDGSGQLLAGRDASSYFGQTGLNADGRDHEVLRDNTYDPRDVNFEDLYCLGDRDFDDASFNVQVKEVVEQSLKDTFTYEITDGKETDTAVVCVDITGGNTPPDAVDDHVSGAVGQPIVIDVLANDSDADGDNITIDSIVTGPSHGTASIVDGKIVYTPNVELNSEKMLEKTGADLKFDISGSKGLTIDLSNITTDADYHNTVGYYFAGADGKPMSGAILADDVHYDKSAKAIISEGNIPSGAVSLGFFVIPNGKAVNWGIGDNMHVNFANVNGKWVAKTDYGSIIKGTGANAYFSDRNLNPDGMDHEITLKGSQNSGWEDLFRLGDKDFNDVGFNVKVTSKVNDTLSDSFEYKISDGKGGYDTAKVDIDLHSDNHTPDAADDCFTVKSGSTVRMNLLENDSDSLGHDIDLSKIAGYDVQDGSTFRTGYGYVKVVDAEHGLIDFKAFSDCNTGKVKLFDYTITDSEGKTDTATVSINIESNNDWGHGDWWC